MKLEIHLQPYIVPNAKDIEAPGFALNCSIMLLKG